MKTEIIAALLFRMLGVVMLLLGTFVILGVAISYFSLWSAGPAHDVYFVVTETAIWSSLLFVVGAVFLLFSKTLGRVLAQGLQ